MSFADNIKAKIKGADLEAQLTNLVDEGEQLVKDGVTKAGAVAHEKRDDIDGWLGKATEAINTKTEGKYADQLTKLRTTLLSGIDKVAEKRQPDDDATPPESPAAPESLEGPQDPPVVP